jgi:signal peptidase I
MTWSYSPRRVVRPFLVLKRVVGLAGDTLSMSNGVLTRNGVAVDEPFMQLIDSSTAAGEDLHQGRPWQLAHLIPTRGHAYRPTTRTWGPIVVPNDSLFVLGDNRDNSFDSRFWGAVSTHQVRGHPLVVYFSWDSHGIGPLPIRWNRIGRRF